VQHFHRDQLSEPAQSAMRVHAHGDRRLPEQLCGGGNVQACEHARGDGVSLIRRKAANQSEHVSAVKRVQRLVLRGRMQRRCRQVLDRDRRPRRTPQLVDGTRPGDREHPPLKVCEAPAEPVQVPRDGRPRLSDDVFDTDAVPSLHITQQALLQMSIQLRERVLVAVTRTCENHVHVAAGVHDGQGRTR